MTEETQNTAEAQSIKSRAEDRQTLAQRLAEELEAKREEIKGRLNLDDKGFEILIRDSIIASFLELGVRIREDDPILAVVLSQKRVMDYYSFLISEALKSTPSQIGNAIELKVAEIKDVINTFVEDLEEFQVDFLKEINAKSLENNNTIITSFDKFIDKKTQEIKQTLENVKSPQTAEIVNASQTSRIVSLLIIVLLLANLAISGLSAFGGTSQKNVELQYQKGLISGFSEVRKNINAKDAEKVEKIIINSIDEQLKNAK